MVNSQQSIVNGQQSMVNSQLQRVVFFGSGDFVIPVIEKLLNHNLVLVVTNDKNGKLINFCHEKNIDCIVSDLKDTETINKILSLNSTIAVLASFGEIIPKAILDAFPNGIINIHPSLLPKWKGPSPVQYTLLNGETQTGVTLIKLDDEIDHGPILTQKVDTLSGNETAEDLLSILFEIGAGMAEEAIIKLESGETLSETPQDHNRETWSYKIEKKDGFIDLSKIPTNELEIKNYKLEIARKVRAYYPWPGVWFRTNLKDQEKLIKLLPENRIQVEGKNIVSYKDFINGFGEEGKEILEKLNLA